MISLSHVLLCMFLSYAPMPHNSAMVEVEIRYCIPWYTVQKSANSHWNSIHTYRHTILLRYTYSCIYICRSLHLHYSTLHYMQIHRIHHSLLYPKKDSTYSSQAAHDCSQHRMSPKISIAFLVKCHIWKITMLYIYISYIYIYIYIYV